MKKMILCWALISLKALAQNYPLPQSNERITYREKTFTTHDGHLLHGHLAIPTALLGKEPLPVVIMYVGSGPGNRYEAIAASMTSNNQDSLLFLGIEEELAKKGIAAFLYDKRGIRPLDQHFMKNEISEVFKKTATAKNLALDALTAFDLVKTLPEIDPQRIFLLSHSEGTVLARKVAEERPEVHALFLLGLFTRNFTDILYYQGVVSNMRIMGLVDHNQDGLISEEEWAPFHQDNTQAFPLWSALLTQIDFTQDSFISMEEWRYVFEEQNRAFMKTITSDFLPWRATLPREWFQEYLAEGKTLQKFLGLCEKIHIFHGEVDMQTPFEDALELKVSCDQKRTKVRSFHSYPGMGHAFSERTGHKRWRDTVGPMSPKVQIDIAAEASRY